MGIGGIVNQQASNVAQRSQYNPSTNLSDIEREYRAALAAIERYNTPTMRNVYNQMKEQIEQNYANLKNQSLESRNEQDREMVLSRFKELSNPTSQYYRNINQQVRDNLSSVYNPNSLLAVAKATGLSSGGASTIANQQRRAQEKRINEYANQATNQAFTNATGMGNSLLGLAQGGTGQLGQFQNAQAQLNLGYAGLNEQRRQFNASQPGFWDYAGALGGSLLGTALGGEKPWWLGGGNG